jgi:hypothetical protein
VNITWADHLIPRTADYVWDTTTETWQWIKDDPERALQLIVAFLLIAVALYLLLSYLDMKRRWLLRGSKMPKKARRKWVRRHIVDGYQAWLEREAALGRLTDGEVAAAVRMIRRAVMPEATWEAAVKWQNQQRSKQKLAEMSVKERICLRLSRIGKRLLYTPAKIPGPPVPNAQAKALAKPVRKKGEMFARKTPRTT